MLDSVSCTACHRINTVCTVVNKSHLSNNLARYTQLGCTRFMDMIILHVHPTLGTSTG